MAAITLTVFSGIAPRVSPRLLKETKAQRAVNIKPWSGELRPMGALLPIGSDLLAQPPGTKQAIYRYGQDAPSEAQFWFRSAALAHYVRGAIAGDTNERTYWSGGGGVPKMTTASIATSAPPYPSSSLNLGIPAPAATTQVAVASRTLSSITNSTTSATATAAAAHGLNDGDKVVVEGAAPAAYNVADVAVKVLSATSFSYTMGSDPGAAASAPGTFRYSGTLESRVYALCYLSPLGERGKPSLPTVVADVYPGQIVTLTNLPTSGPGAGYDIDRKAIYRTQSGEAETTYRKVAELPLATASYQDAFLGTQLGAAIESANYDPPPADLFHLTGGPNGQMGALSGVHGLCMCVPYEPHAWPLKYRYALRAKPIGLGQFGQTWVVLTDGVPVVFVGVAPQAMSSDDVRVGQPCTSGRGVVSMNGQVYYPCPEGIAAIGPAGWGLATAAIFTKDEWAGFAPASIHAYEWQGRYVGFYDTGAVQAGFVFEPDTGEFWTLDFYASAGYYDAKFRALYLALGDALVKFDGNTAAPLAYTWRSKVFVTPKPLNFAYAKVVAAAYPVVCKVYGDGVLRATRTVAGKREVALPGGYTASDWEIELSGTAAVKSCTLAEAARELRAIME